MKKKILIILFVVPVGILLILLGIYYFTKGEPIFFTKTIRIIGASQVGEAEIVRKINPYLKESLFSIDASKINEVVKGHPYVREVRVKRVFPFTLLIDVAEKRPSAYWVTATGDVFVLDENGEPYRKFKKNDPGGLFVINAKQKQDAKSLYEEIKGWIDGGVLKKELISEIAYDEGNVTIYGQEDGIEILLGKEQQKERIKRALAILDDAKRRGIIIRCIDARFEGGAIIKERKG